MKAIMAHSKANGYTAFTFACNTADEDESFAAGAVGDIYTICWGITKIANRLSDNGNGLELLKNAIELAERAKKGSKNEQD